VGRLSQNPGKMFFGVPLHPSDAGKGGLAANKKNKKVAGLITPGGP